MKQFPIVTNHFILEIQIVLLVQTDCHNGGFIFIRLSNQALILKWAMQGTKESKPNEVTHIELN